MRLPSRSAAINSRSFHGLSSGSETWRAARLEFGDPLLSGYAVQNSNCRCWCRLRQPNFIHVACYTTSLYVVDFKCASNSDETERRPANWRDVLLANSRCVQVGHRPRRPDETISAIGALSFSAIGRKCALVTNQAKLRRAAAAGEVGPGLWTFLSSHSKPLSWAY